MDPVKELCELIEQAGLRPAFGLYQQGKLSRVFEMRQAGKDWNEIGAAIGWDPKAAEKWYADESVAGAVLIHFERNRQIEKEGHTIEGDAGYEANELLDAAVCYIDEGSGFFMDQFRPGAPEWPWRDAAGKPVGFKPVTMGAEDEREQRIRALVKAGALIAAEIDRLRLGGA